MAGIKIIDLPALGRDLASTDLFELSLAGGTGSRKITGQEILNSAKSGLVPTTRTLTINGTTQDLSADRTFTISTGITIGSTAINSGTVGRVLFEGTGNVVSESANLFWDNTNGRLGIGTSTPVNNLQIHTTSTTAVIRLTTAATGSTLLDGFAFGYDDALGGLIINRENTPFGLWTNNTEQMRIHGSGNVSINTTTDSGYKLDVNGTARVVGPTFAVGDWTQRSTSVYVRALTGGAENRGFYIGVGASNDGNVGSFTYQQTTGMLNIRSPYNSGTIALSFEGNTNSVQFHNQTGTAVSKFFSGTGNLGIGTTTDAGYKLDVNGTARVSGVFNVGSDTARIDLWRSSGAFGGRIGTGYLNPAVNHVYIQCDTNSKAILIDDSNRTLFSSSNGDTTIASAQVTINSATRGFLPPRMTTTQKNAIATPVAGLMVYDTTLNVISYYNGTMWI